MEKTYNVGIIGFGFIGRVHAYAHLNLPLFYDPVPCRTRITHVCTAHPDTAEKGRLQIGAEHATTDYRQITENSQVDIVHICTPNDLHKEQLLSAMRYDKHIYCDKPLAANMDEAREIERALTTYRGVAQMTFQNRFFPATIRARQLIDEGLLGQILEFRMGYLHSGSANPDAPLKWKLSAARGGGVIADLGSHVLDLAQHLLGDLGRVLALTQIAYPERPSASDPSLRSPVEAEDAVKILVRARSGATGVIEASKISTGTEDELRFEIHGSQGALRFNSMAPHVLEVYDVRADGGPVGGRRGWTRVDTGQRYPKPAGFPGPKFAIGWIRSHVACLAHFVTHVAKGQQTELGLAQGVRVQRIIECVRLSAQTGQWTEV